MGASVQSGGGADLLFRRQVFAFATVWVAYCVTYFLRKPLGIVKPEIGRELSMTKAQLGWLDLALLLPYSVVQVALSPLWDRAVPRVVVGVCLAAASVAMLLFCASPGFLFAAGCLFISGAAQAPIWPACTKVLSSWYPEDRLGSVFGAIHTSPYAGALVGTSLAIFLQERFQWRVVFAPSAAAGVAVAAFAIMYLKTSAEAGVDVPGQVVKKDPQQHLHQGSSSVWSLLSVPSVPELSAAVFCLKFVRYCMYMWLPLYFVEFLGYSKALGGVFSLAFDVGGIVGSPAVGYLVDRKFSHSPILGVGLVSLLGCAAFALMSTMATWGPVYVTGLLLVAGAANCGPDSLLTGSVSSSVGERLGGGRGAGVTSVVNGLGGVGAILEGPVVGFISHEIGWAGVVYGMVLVSLAGAAATLRAHAVASRGIRTLGSQEKEDEAPLMEA